VGNFEATWAIWLIFAAVFAIAEIFTHGFLSSGSRWEPELRQ